MMPEANRPGYVMPSWMYWCAMAYGLAITPIAWIYNWISNRKGEK